MGYNGSCMQHCHRPAQNVRLSYSLLVRTFCFPFLFAYFMQYISGYKAMSSFTLCLAETIAQHPAQAVGLLYLCPSITLGATHLLWLPEKHIVPMGTRATAGLMLRLGALGDSRTKRESQHPHGTGTGPRNMCSFLGFLHLRAAAMHLRGEAHFLCSKHHSSCLKLCRAEP